jgi:2'-hydroxyisoflavone reductase
MPTTRRDLIKLGVAASAASLLAGTAGASSEAPRKKLRILILGGTGFIGPHQVRYALARGHQITLFNRGRKSMEWPGEVEQLTGDRNTGDLKALEGREWDVCIDNPTSVPFWVRDVGKVLKRKVEQYVFISTLSVYAENLAPGADEDAARAEYTGKDVMAETRDTLIANIGQLYGPLKRSCEDEALKWFGKGTTLIRPGLIVGPGDETDRFSYWPVRIARGGEILAPGDGSDPVKFIDARDLAEWTIRMVENGTTGAFNAIGPDYELSTAALLYGIRATRSAHASFTWVDSAFLEAQNVSPWGDMPVWVPGTGDSAGFHRMKNERAIAAGLTFRPLATTAIDTLAWFRAQPPERQAQLKAGIKPEREAEVLAAWKVRTPA